MPTPEVERTRDRVIALMAAITTNPKIMQGVTQEARHLDVSVLDVLFDQAMEAVTKVEEAIP